MRGGGYRGKEQERIWPKCENEIGGSGKKDEVVGEKRENYVTYIGVRAIFDLILIQWGFFLYSEAPEIILHFCSVCILHNDRLKSPLFFTFFTQSMPKSKMTTHRRQGFSHSTNHACNISILQASSLELRLF